MKNKLKYLIAAITVAAIVAGSAVHAAAAEIDTQSIDGVENVTTGATGTGYGAENATQGAVYAGGEDKNGAHDITDAVPDTENATWGTADAVPDTENAAQVGTYSLINTEDTAPTDESTSPEQMTDSEVKTEGGAGTEGGTDNGSGKDQATDTEDGESDGNLFSRIYAELTAYAAEILCALTFAGSVTLAVAYKKGLLPLLEKSLVSIGNAVARIRDSAKESAQKSDEIGAVIDGKLTATKEVLDTLAERVATLSETLGAIKKDEECERIEKEKVRLVMSAQIDMLYDIFMSSALPQYQKDAVGERIGKMKEALHESYPSE